MYKTKDNEGTEYNCPYCEVIMKYDEEDNTWICVNSECWASKEIKKNGDLEDV